MKNDSDKEDEKDKDVDNTDSNKSVSAAGSIHNKQEFHFFIREI